MAKVPSLKVSLVWCVKVIFHIDTVNACIVLEDKQNKKGIAIILYP
jgi:hypothetical protein